MTTPGAFLWSSTLLITNGVLALILIMCPDMEGKIEIPDSCGQLLIQLLKCY
jgi:hypothetical protein